MIDLSKVPLPPSPSDANDVLPPAVNPSVIFQDLDLKDVIAAPLYAYVEQPDGSFENYDRRNMRLSAKGDWVNLLAVRVTPQSSLDQTVTVREGIVSSLERKESFARNIGVELGANVQAVKFGTKISETLTQSTGQGFEIANSTEISTRFTAQTTAEAAAVWLWQLDLAYLLSGDLITWAVRGSKGKKQLTGKDSRAVLTRDGAGRERTNGQQVDGAKRIGVSRFTAPLMANKQVFVYTAAPSTSAVTVTMEEGTGQDITIMSYDELLTEVARIRAAVAAETEAEAA